MRLLFVVLSVLLVGASCQTCKSFSASGTVPLTKGTSTKLFYFVNGSTTAPQRVSFALQSKDSVTGFSFSVDMYLIPGACTNDVAAPNKISVSSINSQPLFVTQPTTFLIAYDGSDDISLAFTTAAVAVVAPSDWPTGTASYTLSVPAGDSLIKINRGSASALTSWIVTAKTDAKVSTSIEVQRNVNNFALKAWEISNTLIANDQAYEIINTCGGGEVWILANADAAQKWTISQTVGTITATALTAATKVTGTFVNNRAYFSAKSTVGLANSIAAVASTSSTSSFNEIYLNIMTQDQPTCTANIQTAGSSVSAMLVPSGDILIEVFNSAQFSSSGDNKFDLSFKTIKALDDGSSTSVTLSDTTSLFSLSSPSGKGLAIKVSGDPVKNDAFQISLLNDIDLSSFPNSESSCSGSSSGSSTGIYYANEGSSDRKFYLRIDRDSSSSAGSVTIDVNSGSKACGKAAVKPSSCDSPSDTAPLSCETYSDGSALIKFVTALVGEKCGKTVGKVACLSIYGKCNDKGMLPPPCKSLCEKMVSDCKDLAGSDSASTSDSASGISLSLDDADTSECSTDEGCLGSTSGIAPAGLIAVLVAVVVALFA